MSLRPKRSLIVLLLAAAVSIGVEGTQSSANSEQPSSSSLLTAPAELLPASSEIRFSRLLKNNSNRLQFTSIGNDSPVIYGLKKDSAERKANSISVSTSSFGRRALDYDESHGFDEPSRSETKHIGEAGSEYVYVRSGKGAQVVEPLLDSDVAASVTSINNKPPRVPLALLRQKKGNRVNISPLFTELPPLQDADVAAKEFVWVDKQPNEQQFVVGIKRQGRKQEEVDDATINPLLQEEEIVEATTTLPEETLLETTTSRLNRSKMIVNVVTSAPRVSVESNVSEKKERKHGRFRVKSTSTTTTTSTTTSTTTEAASEATSPSTTVSSTTSEAPTTAAPPVLSSSSPKSADDKENLVTDAFHRTGSSFHGFEDSATKLQTAESSQPARVNVRPAQNGKEYEYEYIYYYYDDDDDNSTSTEKHEGGKVVKQVGSTTTTLTPSSGAAAPASSSTPSIASSTTTTLSPQLTSEADADFEYDDDGALEEEVQVQQVPEIQKSTPAIIRTTEEPIHKGISSAEKISHSNLNQLDRSRSPKILSAEKFDDAAADYKLETEASQEDEQVHEIPRSKGQPLRQPVVSSEEDDHTGNAPDVPREPSTVPPAATIPGIDISHMSTLAKTHKDSVNVPIVLKQSSLLKAVPVSQLQPHQVEQEDEHPATVPLTTPSTTTTVEVASEPAAPVRPVPPRLRGQGQRLRGSVTPRPSTTAAADVPAQASEDKPQQPVRRPPSRRIPARRPGLETADKAPEQEPAASPIIEQHARPLPIRPRFPPRTGAHTATTAAAAEVSDSPPTVTVSAAELNSLEDKKTKDTHVRSKSANDLYAFTRLQQAISSRAPGRVPPKLVAGFVNSAEVTTDAMTSSEVTTVSSLGGQSSETVVSDESPSTPSTTTTTTTEAVQLDKFGRQRPGSRFGGRTRKPLAGGSGSSTTTEAPASSTARGRFTGRRRSSTTETPEGTAQQSSASTTNAEAPKPRIPSRNRFASRNRGSTSTEASAAVSVDAQKTPEADKPSTPAVAQAPRRRPGAFQGRRRPNQLQGQSESSSAQEENASVATNDASSATASSTAAPSAAPENPGRNRFNFAAGGRARPGAPAAAAANNPVRIRGGGRLRGPTTSTTTEAAPEEVQSEGLTPEQPADAEQSPTIHNENLEQPIPSTIPPETAAPPRGVLGRLKNRPKLVVTTTPPPEAPERKGGRLNGLLNRRKNLGQLAAAVHVKEEVRESTSEGGGEEANNHAQEQTDEDHKGVVVQISSSITESEEVNDGNAAEVVEPSSTTPASILNRLKSQRKPGSLVRKKPQSHGE